MPLPNLFILGAPKCGTTSLFDYLVQYPEIDIGVHKEPHFFNEDQPEFRHVTDLAQYKKLFNRCSGRSLKYAVDASTHYIYSGSATQKILQFCPDAKFIAMVRHPFDLIRSYHEHLVYRQVETELELPKAWELGPLRDRAPAFVKKAPYPGFLTYRMAGALGEHLLPIKKLLDDSNLMIVFFEDVVNDQVPTLRRIADFLDLDFDDSLEFRRSNYAKRVRSNKLNQLLFFPGPAVKLAKKIVKQIMPRELIRKADFISRAGKPIENRVELPAAFRSQVIQYFRDDIQILSELTSRDLAHWLC